MHLYKTLDDGIRIVEYEPSLAGALAEMWRQSADSWGGEGENQTPEQIAAEHAMGAFFNVFVAMKDDEAVGYCSFDRYYKDADTAYVHLLNVRPDYHGKKVGKELVLLCVEKTIEMGYPRLDINTWAGNTKAVPLYKKCGFLWEDRADSTHLQNQIPTVLSTELFADFFKTADWYRDSTRVIEVKPDGIKENGFELFGYSWAKDGRALSVGFERTGRRVRRAETDDYLIEMMAEHHAPAFGLSYKCVFRVENKSGAPLRVAVDGKNDGPIAFDYHADAEIEGTRIFEAEFSVGAVTEEQDAGRVHPCVLAEVTVNGKKAEFGLGIEPRFPLTAALIEKRLVPRAGTSVDVYLNLESALPADARVSFALPENPLLRFAQERFTADIGARDRACVATRAEVAGLGYAALPVTYDIALKGGRSLSFTRPLHIVGAGPGAAFAYETESHYGAANGLWKLSINKKSNYADFGRVHAGTLAVWGFGKLGKPYDDEFNLLAPAATRFAARDGRVAFEADFASRKYPGAVLTEIYAFDAAGTLEHRQRLANTSDRALGLFLKSDLHLDRAARAVVPFEGALHGVTDDLSYGFSNFRPEQLTEPWIFDGAPGNPLGVFWPEDVRPSPRWGETLAFEYDAGELPPGGTFETGPVTMVAGAFNNARDFRNYVLGRDEAAAPHILGHLEIEANGMNPVLSGRALDIKAINRRPRKLEGTIELRSEDGLFAPIETAKAEEWSEAALRAELPASFTGVSAAALSMRFMNFEKGVRRALLVPGGKPVETTYRDGVWTASSGALAFSVSDGYCGALHSLTYEGREWLYSPYPTLAPYGWWNPFIGGIATSLPKMNANLTVRENVETRPAEAKDSFGNAWTGLAARVTIEQFEEHRGLAYEQYYLTLPGAPVLCCFVRLVNRSGAYRSLNLHTEAFLCGKEGLSQVFLSYEDEERNAYRLRAGREDGWQRTENLCVVSREGANARPERMHVYRDARRDGGENALHTDVYTASVSTQAKAAIRDGESCATRPWFFLLTPKALCAEALEDFGRILFE